MADVVLQWLVSASTCICAQSNREVHRLFTVAFFLFAASPGVDLYLKAEMDVACYEGCPVNADRPTETFPSALHSRRRRRSTGR